jgi:hypothetical protein
VADDQPSAGVPRRGGFGDHEVEVIVDRCTVEDRHSPDGESGGPWFVALGTTPADLEADVGDARVLRGHLAIAGTGCPCRQAYPSSALAMTTRWI